MKKIVIADYTLRRMQELGMRPLLFREKIAMVKTFEQAGVDVVELPAVTNPKEDSVMGKAISAAAGDLTLSIPAGSSDEDNELAWNCICHSKNPRLQILLPVSTVQIEYQYHIKDKAFLELIANRVALAKSFCQSVEFCALDASRADSKFLLEACRTAVDAGADCITLHDDAGVAFPDTVSDMVSSIRTVFNGSLSVALDDRIGMSVANALSAFAAGADGVKTSLVSGMIPSSLPILTLSEAIRMVGDTRGITSSLNMKELRTDVNGLRDAFAPAAHAPADSDFSEIVLDASSTPAQTAVAVTSLGYDLSDADLGNVHSAVLSVCETKGSVGKKELEALIASVAMQVPSTFHLKSFVSTNGTQISSMTKVILLHDGEELTGMGYGDGPIDASFNAIEQCIGSHYELDDFQVQAVTEGREALGSALVRLRSNGRLYSGNGISPDIVNASIRAYLNALNKIVYEESVR
ncbi:MAG: hypothetical protein II719_05150 [Clostridia bacterium]|nr:hypothetical protein [Clostridia bacterium]